MALLTFGDVRAIGRTGEARREWPTVTATVASAYTSGRHEVPITYVHPVTHQSIDVDVVVVNESSLPEPGSPFTVAVDLSNPDRVVVPGDGDPVREIIVGWIVILGTAIAAAAARWMSIARSERLINRSRPSFAMLAALTTAGQNAYKAQCSLYAIDAAAGAQPVCTFTALTTRGLPIDGPAFPVEVRGRPVPGGLLVARAGERIIRPVRRPLTRGRRPRPAEVTPSPPALPPASPPPPGTSAVAPLWRSIGPLVAVCIGGAVVGTAVAVPLLIVGERRDHQLARDGRPIVVELIGKDDDQLVVRYESGEGSPLELTTHGSEDRVVGRLYPAHIDESNRVRLDADPYNSGTPIGFLTGVWGIVILLGWPRIRWRRDGKAAARHGPWFHAVGRFDGPNFVVASSSPGHGGYFTTCRAHPRRAGLLVDVRVAGSLDPGQAVAVAGPCASTGRAWAWGHGLPPMWKVWRWRRRRPTARVSPR